MGGNFRLDELQAAVLRVKAPHLTAWNDARRANAARYNQLLGAVPGVATPVEPEGYRHIYHQYVVRVPRRDALKDHLVKAGIGCEVYYPVPLHVQPCFAPLGYRAGDCPVSEAAALEVLALPIYAELTEAQLGEVAGVIGAFYRGLATGFP